MKKFFYSLFVLSLGLNAMAETLEVTCYTDEDKIVVVADTENDNKPQMLSIYNQAGLGPNYLASSYLSTKGLVLFTPADSLFVETELPFGGKFQVEFLDIFSDSAGIGSMIFPGRKSAVSLNNCVYKIK